MFLHTLVLSSLYNETRKKAADLKYFLKNDDIGEHYYKFTKEMCKKREIEVKDYYNKYGKIFNRVWEHYIK